MTSMLEKIERQLKAAQRDLESEMFRARVLEQDGEPFSALKCERLYRTIRALRKRKDDLLEQSRSHKNQIDETTDKSFYYSFRSSHESNLERRNPTQPVSNAWTLQKRAEQKGVEEKNATKFPEEAFGPEFFSKGLRLDPTIDKSFATDNHLESWTWNGRPLQLVREARREMEWGAMREQMTQLDSRLGKLEKTGKKVESEWSEETKQKVEKGEKIGEERVKARMQAKRELERQARILRQEIEHESAMSVQCMFRGHLGRKKMRDARAKYDAKIKNENVVIVQSSWRGHIDRKKVRDKKKEMLRKKQVSSATVIQNQYRGRVARDQLRHAKSKKEKEYAAACVIQAWWRGCVGRKQVLSVRNEFYKEIKEAAALMLQAAWRCYKARKEVNRLKNLKLKAMEEAAAMMVQAAWRDFQARKKLRKDRKKLKQIDTEKQNMEWTERVGKQFYSNLFMTVKQRAATRIQNYFRAFKARKRVKKMKEEDYQLKLKEIELEKQRRKMEMEKEIEDKIREAEAQKISKFSPEKDFKLVFTGQFQMPIEKNVDDFYEDSVSLDDQTLSNSNRRRRVQDVVDVSISVKERRNPYQLLFRVKEQSQGRVFTRAIDHRILDKILEPLFKNQASAAIDTSFEIEREDAMLDWVRTGKPPKRKQMISWMLDRMWICQDEYTDEYELCLGSNVASVGSELRNTITNHSKEKAKKRIKDISPVKPSLTISVQDENESIENIEDSTSLLSRSSEFYREKTEHSSALRSSYNTSTMPTRRAFQVFYADKV